jgi:hypothetical protein
MTVDGIIPVSEALRKDRAALSATAITYPIEDEWRNVVSKGPSAYPFSATLHQSETLLLVGTNAGIPGAPVSFVANARTGAWARYIGWDVRCSAVHNEDLYFGNDAGKVMKANTGGQDDGEPFTAVYVPKFRDLRGPVGVVNHVGAVYRAALRATVALGARGDYDALDIPSPTASAQDSVSSWGTSQWATFIWGGTAKRTFQIWKAARAEGSSLAPTLAVKSDDDGKLAFEILATRIRYETGRPF